MIKFMQHYILDTETNTKVKVWYMAEDLRAAQPSVTILAKDRGYELDRLFPGVTKNNSADYLDKSMTVLFADHPLYKDARKRLEMLQAKRAQWLNSLIISLNK